MNETIEFQKAHFYDSLKTGITLTATLSYGDEVVKCETKLDTGASHCIFKRSHGELLGLDIESGVSDTVGIVTGSFAVFGHNITLEVLGIKTESFVYFAAEDIFTRNVLGRVGWLDRVKLGLIDYESKILLASYHDQDIYS